MSLPPSAADRAKLFSYRPGLDGLRGLAVVAVLAFHGGFGWAKGGYLGVSAFFTLSGFLIATLLLREREVAGAVRLRGFWGRRARRLLPAGLIGLILAIAYAAIWADTTNGLRADVLACLGYVANWHFVFAERSYADLFTDPSPVQHYWSLAVEEQFYVVFPLLVLGCGALARRRFRTVLVTVLVALSTASVAVSTLLVGPNGQTDRAYYGTDTRAVEILLGVLAALAVMRVSASERPPAAAGWTTAAGAVGLVAMVAMWATIDGGHSNLHPWLLVIHAMAAVAVINAAVRTGPVADALSWSALRALGRISYGIYVYHWPVFLALSPARTGWAPVPLFAVRVAITLALAGASWRWIERPIVTGSWSRPRIGRGFAIAVATVAIAVIAIPSGRDTTIDFDAAASTLDRPATPRSPTETEPESQGPLHITVLGDSIALMSALGIDAWGQTSGEIRVDGHGTQLGCPLLEDGSFQYVGMQDVPDRCNWAVTWATALGDFSTEVAVVHMGTWDIVERTLPGYRGRMRIGDPVIDGLVSDRLDASNDELLKSASTVIWLTLPQPAPFAESFDATVGARVDRFNELVRAAAQRAAGRVQIVDMADWIAAYGPEDRTLRPDGVHFSDESSQIAGAWLGPAIIYAASHPGEAEVSTADVSVSDP